MYDDYFRNTVHTNRSLIFSHSVYQYVFIGSESRHRRSTRNRSDAHHVCCPPSFTGFYIPTHAQQPHQVPAPGRHTNTTLSHGSNVPFSESRSDIITGRSVYWTERWDSFYASFDKHTPLLCCLLFSTKFCLTYTGCLEDCNV